MPVRIYGVQVDKNQQLMSFGPSENTMVQAGITGVNEVSHTCYLDLPKDYKRTERGELDVKVVAGILGSDQQVVIQAKPFAIADR